MGQIVLPDSPVEIDGGTGFGGNLDMEVRRAFAPPPSKTRSLRIGNKRLILTEDKGSARILGREIFATHLHATIIRRNLSGEIVSTEERDMGSGVVTDAGCALLALDYSNATATLKLANFHQTGSGLTAEAVGQTALVTALALSGGTSAPIGTGTQSNPASKQYRSVATVVYTIAAPPLAITEWGLFTLATGSGTGTMWDRRLFAAINVDSSTSIQFTYTLTCVSGG